VHNKDIFHDQGSVRFIIISVLPEPPRIKVINMMTEISLLAAASRAIKYPPHITLRTGVLVPVGELDSFVEEFGEHTVKFEKSESHDGRIVTGNLELMKYCDGGSLKNILLYPVGITEWLKALNKHLLMFRRFIKSDKTDFSPHISVAYDDLMDERLDDVKNYIIDHRNVFDERLEFDMDSVSLYYEGINGFWTEYRRFSLA